MIQTLSLSASASTPELSASPRTASLFTRERAATSLNDLSIVRKIVEREGCIEALTQLLTARVRALNRDRRDSRDVTSAATLVAAPAVAQSLLDQLRSAGVQIVESIEHWRRANGTRVFQWRGLNYLLKMIHDLDFLALHAASLAPLDAFKSIRLHRNPFLAPIHLDHVALRGDTRASQSFVGSTETARIIDACRVLLREEAAQSLEAEADVKDEEEDNAGTTRVHWSHQPMKGATLVESSDAGATVVAPASVASDSKADALECDVHLTRELIFQHEHELGAIREDLAVLAKKIAATDAPDKRRRLQQRHAALTHELQLRTGDLFHRRNELQRKETAVRIEKRRLGSRQQAREATAMARRRDVAHEAANDGDPAANDDNEDDSDEEPDAGSLRYRFLPRGVFREELAADELRRLEWMERFTSYTKQRASVSSSFRASSRPLTSPQPRAKTPSRERSLPSAASLPPIDRMTSQDVEAFVNGLDLGSTEYGAMLRARGIDGELLLQATDRDLEELGVCIRLHRIKILDAVRRASE
ncbi:hypothetical protein PINS_up001984 [Pythium insidiosum]|nr:hypothetical protein PINS_up001984 [Pythium insidiosum]